MKLCLKHMLGEGHEHVAGGPGIKSTTFKIATQLLYSHPNNVSI